jgi:hypothetical protein
MPARPFVEAREGSVAAEIEEWLRGQASTSAPVLWCPRGTAEATVGGVDALTAKVATLVTEGDWAVARRTNGRTWTQCMRVDGGWIVEVNGIPGPDCFARRVRSSSARKGMMRGRRRVRDRGRVMATFDRADVIGSPEVASAVMWSWLRGALPAGYELKDIEVVPRSLRE